MSSPWIWALVCVLLLAILSKITELREQVIKSRQATLAELQARQSQVEKENLALAKRREEYEEWEKQARAAIDLLAQQKATGFPWLAEAYSDFFYLQELRRARLLETKERPALKAAEELRSIASRRKTAEQQLRINKYLLDYYESLFPWLVELRGDDVDELLIQVKSEAEDDVTEQVDTEDGARKWLAPEEYERLPSAQKYQLALDRYVSSRKSRWQIGRDYERFVGFQYERLGFKVYYQGIADGLEDMGRDLIATKPGITVIIQCKHWSSSKTIHEKHIFQLFGTTVEYWLKEQSAQSKLQPCLFPDLLRQDNIQSLFVTSTALSPKARDIADILNVQICENFPLQPYPLIKCNISQKNGEKIYHLPFDQQYDKVVVDTEQGEFFALTIAEAEASGFRRAFKWHGNDGIKV